MPADMVAYRQAVAVQPAAEDFSTLVHEIVEATWEHLQLAQAHMVVQANKHHHDV